MALVFSRCFAVPTSDTISAISNKIVFTDTDTDGVEDGIDLCPNTPNGTAVNKHGCPIALITCDYTTTNIAFNTVTVPPVDKKNEFLLIDAQSTKIVQISNIPAFNNIVGEKTYMIIAVTYENDGSIVGLNIGAELSQVNASCIDFSNAISIKICSPVNDADADGVEDALDLCPNTTIGLSVNKHGCPVELANCDYNTSTFTFSTITQPTAGKETRFLLVDAKTTNIIQISTNTTFSGIVGTKTYMIIAISYENDGTLTGLAVGEPLGRVTASCIDFSRVLVVKVCSPFIESPQCDFSTTTISLKLSTMPQVGYITKYLLVNSLGTIVQLNNLPTFANLSGSQDFNAFALTYSNDNSINNLAIGQKIDNVTANCLDWSNPLPIKVCICKPNICVPFTILKTKNKL